MIKDLLKKSPTDLTKLLKDKQVELSTFRFGGAGAKVTNVKAGRNLRREIAQIKTVLNNPAK
ncbi:MAG: 50S ribosomal protein L29 [bacterium]|nr:50S ribosomal protein L29 [bacterium]